MKCLEERALLLMDQMPEMSLVIDRLLLVLRQRTVVTYGTAISACSWSLALQLLWQVLFLFLKGLTEASQHVRLNVICFNAALNSCAKALQWRKALWLLHEAG